MIENKHKINTINTEMNNSKMNKIISTLKIVFLAENLSGICRFSFIKAQLVPSDWKRKTYAICLIVMNITLYAAFLDLPGADETTSLDDVLDEIPMLLTLFQYMITLITTNVIFNKANKEIFIKLTNLDGELVSANSDEFYEKAKIKCLRSMVFLVISHIVVSVTGLASDDGLDASDFIYLPLYLIQKLEMAMFCLLIEMLKSRLDIISGYMAKFIDDKDFERLSVFTVSESKEVLKKTINFIGRPSEDNTKIRDLANMYDMIGNICFLVNNVFNFQIFMTLVSTFAYIIVSIWTTLYYYRTPENSSSQLFNIVIWCLTTLLTVALMCFVCERLRLSRANTKIVLNQIIMDYSLPKTMRMQAKAFMELIEAWPLRVLVYDMFSVDITLMLKFISVSTTYLIVIIQVSHLA